MKKTLILSAFLIYFSLVSFTQQHRISVFDEVLFFNGYDALVDDSVYSEYTGNNLSETIIRHSNSLYAKKLTQQQLSSLGDNISMEIIIRAACDNYDRLGNINMALVPKVKNNYIPDEEIRLELGRFITPFMDKNKQPDTVMYHIETPFLKHIINDKQLNKKYDFWIEFELFGVPYAANKEIAGCEGRNDVFFGSLNFISSGVGGKKKNKSALIPLLFKHQLNNYNENATDTLSKTTKRIEFTLEKNLQEAQLVLITSNHGANSGGEEYKRRHHYIYFDNELVLEYKPGRESCEPYRKRNTQDNGIYGRTKKTDEQWQAFSNWCPGDIIDTRIIRLQNLKAGIHSFRINVPEAEFANAQGYIPVSVFLLSTDDK